MITITSKIDLGVFCAVCMRPLGYEVVNMAEGKYSIVAEPCKWEGCASKPRVAPVGAWTCPNCGYEWSAGKPPLADGRCECCAKS